MAFYPARRSYGRHFCTSWSLRAVVNLAFLQTIFLHSIIKSRFQLCLVLHNLRRTVVELVSQQLSPHGAPLFTCVGHAFAELHVTAAHSVSFRSPPSLLTFVLRHDFEFQCSCMSHFPPLKTHALWEESLKTWSSEKTHSRRVYELAEITNCCICNCLHLYWRA